MRADPVFISALLAQIAAADLENANRAPWWVLAALGFLGGTAGVAKIWSALGKYLDDKRDAAKRAAEEEKLRRDAKAKAEIEQIEALTSMARDVPKQFEAMTTRFDAALTKVAETNALTARRLDELTVATRELTSELHSDTRAIVHAIAGKLGIQNNADETNSSGGRRISVPSSPGLEHQTQRA